MPGAGNVDPKGEVKAIALHYAADAGEPIARRFMQGFRAAVDHIRNNPAAGSPRFR